MTRRSYAVLACCVAVVLAVAAGLAWLLYDAWRVVFGTG